MAEKINTKTKVLIAYSTPLHKPDWGEASVLRDVSKLLTKRGYDLSVLTMGKEPQQFHDDFNELVVKAPNPPAAQTEKPAEYLAFLQQTMDGFFDTRAAYNSEEGMKSELEKFAPDIVLTVNFYPPHAIDIMDMIIDYRAKKASYGSAPKLVVMSDDYRFIPEFIELTRYSFLKGENPGTEQTIEFGKSEQKYMARLTDLHMRMLKEADALVYYSDDDLASAQSVYGGEEGRKQSRIQPAVEIDKNIEVNPRENIESTIFLGNFRHLANALGRETIIDKIAPKVPDVKFIVAGAGGVEYKKDNIESYGFVDDAEALIRSADLYISPIQFGHGINTKLITPIKVGTPVVATPFGAAGFPAVHEVNMIVEPDIGLFPAWIEKLSDRETRKKLASNALIEMSDYFSYESVGKRWDSLFSTLVRQ